MDCFAGNTSNIHQYYHYAQSMISRKRHDISNHSEHNLNSHFTCPHCHNPAQDIQHSAFPEHPSFVTFSCNCKQSIISKWCVCVKCSEDNQPKPIAKYQFKSRAWNHQLSTTLEGHICEEQPIPSNIQFQRNLSEEEEEDNHIGDISFDCNTNNSFEEIRKAFPTGNKFNDHVMNTILQCNGNTTLSKYYIKKYWMNGTTCDINLRDTVIFMRLMKSFVFGSRNENQHLAITIGMIEDRSTESNKLLHEQISSLKSQIMNVRNVIESNKSTLEAFSLGHVYSKIDEAITQHYQHSDNTLSDGVEYVKVKLPSKANEIRMLTEGSYSLLQNLLIPRIYTLHCGYAYVLPSECLRLSIAMGSSVDLVTMEDIESSTFPTRSIYHSPEIQEKIRSLHITASGNSPKYYVAIGLWSDGCDIGGTSKSNRSLVKLTTIHIPHKTVNKHHVYPIGLGSHKSDHEELRKIILSDFDVMEEKSMKCYVPSMQQTVDIHFFLAYIVQDRVEHSEFTGFMSHSGTFSTIPGLSFPIRVDNMQSLIIDGNDLSQTRTTSVKPLSSCASCLKKRKSSFEDCQYNDAHQSNNLCIECYDWNVFNVKFKPQKDYPTEHNEFFSDEMKSKVITFDTMKNACKVMYSRLWTKTWSVANAKSFAQIECLRNDLSSSIIDHARQHRPNYAIDLENFDEDEIQFPEHLLPNVMVKQPVSLDQCTVGAMHTLVLNLGKHVLSTLVDLLRENKRWTTFYDKVAIKLIKVRSMSLNWCKTWNFGSKDKPGSLWVSENFLGFGIISKSIISTILEDGFDINASTRSLLEAFFSYNVLIASFMRPSLPSETDIMRMTAVTKLFLSDFQAIDSKIKKRTKSKLETASCLTNLLAIPASIQKRGILRNYWEGGMCGEGFFRILKPLFQRGVNKKGTVKAVMSKLFQDRCITQMLDECNAHNLDSFHNELDNCESFSESNLYDERYRRFHSYFDINAIRTEIFESNPIAIVYHCIHKRFYAMFGYGSTKKIIRIVLKEMVDYLDTACYKIECTEEVRDFGIDDLHIEVMLSSIALPIEIVHLENSKLVRSPGYYYIRTECHQEFIGNDTFVIPKTITQENLRVTIDPIVVCQLNARRTASEANQVLSKCCDRNFCKELEGHSFIHDEGMMIGVVTRFYYKDNKICEENCRWVIKYYYTNDETRARCREKVELTVNEIMEVVNRINIQWSLN